MAGASDAAGGAAGLASRSSSTLDLSPGTTTVAFDPILPPLRVPLKDGSNSGADAAPLFMLAFEDEASWRRAWALSERKIAEQCEAGARMGCSIRASRKCQVPWWKKMIGGGDKDPLSRENAERRRVDCEEQEMSACLASAQENCIEHARDVCGPVFSNMRVAPSEAEAERSGHLRSFSGKRSGGGAPRSRGKEQKHSTPVSQVGPSVRTGGGWEGGLIKPTKDPKPRAEYEEQVSRMLAGGGWNGWKLAEDGENSSRGGGKGLDPSAREKSVDQEKKT